MEREVQTTEKLIKPSTSPSHLLKFFFYSAVGIFMFFIPINLNNQSSIMLDHIVTGIQSTIPTVIPYYALLVILLGAIYPFYSKSWNKDKVNIVFSILKVFGFIIAFMIVFQFGPTWLFQQDMGPFLFDKLVTPVGLLVPIGSVFLALLVGYGLLEFAGVLMKPIMRPVFKTPGRSAIDAVASFVGSYSVGLLITNRIFKEGKYSIKEAAIIATGFSTVSVTFMIVVAKTLGLMDLWNSYFWTTLIVTFLVTAITVRIWPLRSMSDDYYEGQTGEKEEVAGNRLRHAWHEGMKAAELAPSLLQNVRVNLRDGFVMTMSILPSIMSVGLLGLVLVEFTPIFDWVGYIFYPVTALVQLPEPMLAAKASAVGIAEMFLPALLVTEAALVTRFVIGVVSISGIIFFSALVPCILSTDIPLSIAQMVIIWIERIILSILIVTPIAFIIL
ncbi:YjiH family protein [Cytobacillus purgationiresistens]|uniref:Nucleoside recognition membrane protein YjiH n=1 Tax=Cytobacillus purgationiresistens TaxID=863449 RepID=A0ABU0AB07_9BACI|nr:YjiH family protein [Cytobacillus purgationiresistens]MDQ0268435.1 nucleoside recognition membrane protein YjiH [Cytobacillus purgationiresistens]